MTERADYDEGPLATAWLGTKLFVLLTVLKLFFEPLMWLLGGWEHDPETCQWCERDRQAIEVKFDDE